MRLTTMLYNIQESRKLLDPVYYALENSTDSTEVELCRLMTWADSCLMDTESILKLLVGK